MTNVDKEYLKFKAIGIVTEVITDYDPYFYEFLKEARERNLLDYGASCLCDSLKEYIWDNVNLLEELNKEE